MVTQKLRANGHYFLDLFAGSGGFSLGLEAAGFTSLGSIEINPVARKTLELNFGETPLSSVKEAGGDVTKVSLPGLRRELHQLGVLDLDLLVACPPCQAFSRVGRGKLDSLAGAKGSHPADPRNQLYRKVIEYLSVLRPKAFVFENVPGMMSVGGKNIAEELCQGAENQGYVVRAALLNSAWYGVPQLRERVIVLGFRTEFGLEPQFPIVRFEGPEIEGYMSGSDRILDRWKNKTYFVSNSSLPRAKVCQPFRTVHEALRDLPSFTAHLKALQRGESYKALRTKYAEVSYRPGIPNVYGASMRSWSGFATNGKVSDHFCRWTPRDFIIFRQMKEGDRYPDALVIANRLFELEKKRNKLANRSDFVPPYSSDSFDEKWRKLIRNRPSWTVTAHLSKDTYSHIHYDSKQARAITIREAARIQSFPDGFKFFGNTGDAFRQIGNAVPPLLSKHIGASLMTQLAITERSGAREEICGRLTPRRNSESVWSSS